MPFFGGPVDVYRLYLPSDISKQFSGRFKVIGILHLIIGAISIIIEAGLVVFFIQRMGHYPSIAPGAWAGLIFCLAGIFSLLSGATGRYCNVICGMVFAVLSFLAGGAVIACNAYFARKFMMERITTVSILFYDEDNKLIPPLFILVLASCCEVIVSLVHLGIACATSEVCFCCVRKRELRDTEIRLNYPRPVVSTISSAVTRTDSFQYHSAYDSGTMSTTFYGTYNSRTFNV